MSTQEDSRNTTDALAQLVLAIDDEPGVRRLLNIVLLHAGYRVETAADGEAGIRAAAALHPDIVVLDILMPNMSGFEVLTKLKEADPRRPVIMCTVSSDEQTKLKALEQGADDFVAKPFRPDDLISHIGFLLMSPGEGAKRSRLVRLGGLEIDVHHQTVHRNGESLLLSKTEWLLLSLLVSYGGEPALFSDLLVKVWGPDYRDDLQYLRSWITRLGKKLDGSAASETVILDFHGVGYRLNYGLAMEREETPVPSERA